VRACGCVSVCLACLLCIALLCAPSPHPLHPPLSLQVCAVGTLNDDPHAAAAMELFRADLMPSQDVIESAEGRFNLAEYLAKQQHRAH
jgi:hypothetical protein